MKTTLGSSSVSLLSATLGLCFLAGCSQPSANLMSPPPPPPPAPVYVTETATGGSFEVEFNPKVDFIFVVDDSESMLDEQATLQAAAADFVNGFGKNSLIDYRGGVMTVYDSRRYGPGKVNENPFPEGKLRPLKIPEGSPLDASILPPYVSRFEGSDEVLKATLNVGVIPWNQGGPQFEEIFRPLMIATSAEGNATLNANFLRPDSQVAVIVVTDEDDASSEISVDSFVSTMRAQVGADRLVMHGVLAVKGCKRQSYADSPDRLIRAIRELGGKVFPICRRSYGSYLAEIGSDIRKRISDKIIPLDSIPEIGTIEVFYGSQKVPMGKDGWLHDPANKRLIISSSFNAKHEPGAKFKVSFTRIEESAFEQGKAIPQ